MSDPVTNGEMEDVLSSIRRLVSEDSRSRPEGRAGTRPERLVLTPALRVRRDDDGHAKADTAVPLRLDHPRPDAEDESAPPPSRGPVPSEPENDGAAVSSAADGQEAPEASGNPGTAPLDGTAPEGEENAVGPALACTGDVRADAPKASAPAEFPADPPSDGSTAARVLSRLVNQEIARALHDTSGADSQDAAPEAQAETASRPVAEHSAEIVDDGPVETDVTETAAIAEPSDFAVTAPCQNDGSKDAGADDAAQNEAAHQLGTDALDDRPDAAPEYMAGHGADHGAAEAPPEDRSRTELASKIAALEAMVGQKADDWEDDATGPAGAFVHRPAGVADWQGAQPAPEPAMQGGSLPAKDDWYADDPATLDEDMLRDMVAEIVRQELQGALGERITRNVRKLVRREIHRILMSQEVD